MTEKLEDHTEEMTESVQSENPDIGKSTDTYKSVNNDETLHHSSRDRDESGGSAASDDKRNVSKRNVSHSESDSSVESANGSNSNNDDPVDNSEEPEDAPDTFPREYVEKLRDENAKYRQRAQRSDDLAQRLHEALVAATGRLQDPSDLVFDESHLDDPEALQTAIEDLLARKPHLASRRPLGDIGQGVTNGNTGDVDLAALLRSRA